MPQFKLMQHQQEGVKFLDSVDGIGALLWDPGVGKTGATLSWVDSLAARQKEVRVLVVAPLAAVDTWVFQAPSFMDSPVKARMLQGSTLSILSKIAQAGDWAKVPDAAIRADHKGTTARQVSGNRVTIISMSAGAISSYCDERTKTVRMLRAIRKYKPHVIIVDESHIIKSATANVSKAMYQIGQLAPHRIILTGTPEPNGPLDVYGQWRFLAPWTFSDQYGEAYTENPLTMTRAQQAGIRPWPIGRMEKRYVIPGGYKGKGIKDYDNLDELHDRVAERSMVVRKTDALPDLPPVREVDVHFQLSPREAKAYKEMAEDLAAELDDGSLLEAPNALAKMMKLRQVHAGFLKDTDTGEIHIVGNTLRKTVKELVDVTLIGEQRLVVFAYFRSECDMLAASLKAKGQTVELITGATKANDRLAIRRRFADVSGNPERTILVAQQRTMSVSVNELITAQNAIFASISERRNDGVQARGRLDRNGQVGQHVTFWNVFAPGLISNIMIDSQKGKGDLETALFDHVRSFSKNKKKR